MMQKEEVVVANMKRREEQYIYDHPYAITQYKDGRWATNVYDSSGKRKTIACSSLEQLHGRLIEHYRKVEAEQYRKVEAEQKITFPSVCKEWLDEKLRHKEITPSSHTKYMTDYRRFFTTDHEFNQLSVACITDSELRRFIKDTIVDMNLTKKAYNQMQILLKGGLLYAKEEGYTDFSAGMFFFDLVLSDKLFCHKEKPDDETQVFNDDEVQLLVNHLWKEQDLRGLGLILMFQTGMRVGELAALRHESVKNGCIRITATEETYKDPSTGQKIYKKLPMLIRKTGNSTTVELTKETHSGTAPKTDERFKGTATDISNLSAEGKIIYVLRDGMFIPAKKSWLAVISVSTIRTLSLRTLGQSYCLIRASDILR